MLFRAIITSLLLLCYASSVWADVNIELSPQVPAQGEPLTFVLDDEQATSAILYYRVAGATQYQQSYATFRNQQARITLDGSAVVAPGLQYYFKITRNGDVALSPALYPEYSPHTVSVVSRSTPGFELISPEPGKEVQGEQLDIIIAGRNGQPLPDDIFISLDATDITPLVKIVDGRLEFSTSLMPAVGEHTINIASSDSSRQQKNQQWSFQVKDSRPQGTRQLYGKGNISFNYGINLKSDGQSNSSDTLSANASMSFGARGDDWEATWDGVNLRYVKDAEPDDITLGAGFHFTFTKGNQFFEYGDISVNETQLTVPSLSRRGIQAKLKLGENNVNMFYVGANTVKDWDSGLSDTDNFIRGISWQRDFLANKSLPITFVYSDGKDSGNGYNTSSNNPASEGQVFGFAANPTLGNVNFDLEVALSNYDDDISDDRKKQNDFSTLVGLSTILGQFSLAGDYHYYGTDFGSVANPNATTDRSGFSLSGSTRLGPSSINLNGSYDRDNVENDSTRPVVSSTSAGLSWGLALPEWPAINLGYTHSQQGSSKEPVGTDKVDNFNDSVNVSLSTSGDWWSASLGGNYGKLTDQIGNLDSETKGVNFSCSLTPADGFSLSPALNYTTSNTASGVSTDSEVASLTASFPLWKDYLTSNLQGSASHQETSDNSSDSITYNGSFRLAVNFDQLTKQLFDYDGRQSLALTVNYNRVEDSINPDNDTEDWSVFLNFNLLSFSKPIDWSVDF